MWSCTHPPNCSTPIDGPIPYEANPDIAGIGVILAFLISAAAAFALATLGFIIGMADLKELTTFDYNILLCNTPSALRLLPEEDRYPPNGPELNHLIERRAERFHLEREAMGRAVLVLRDQQLFTGLAMLIVGLLKHCRITKYHFKVIIDLAWLSVSVCVGTDFVCGMAVLQNPISKHLRFFFFFALIVFLTIGQVLTMKDNFLPTQEVMGMSMQCSWQPDVGIDYRGQLSSIVAIALLLWAGVSETQLYYSHGPLNTALDYVYVWFLKMLRAPCDLSTLLYVEISKNWKELSTGTAEHPILPLNRVSYCALAFEAVVSIPASLVSGAAFLTFEILTSQTVSLIRNVIMIAWSTMDLFKLRSTAARHGQEGNENEWGFGQMLPVMLLFLPALAIVESLFECYFRGTDESRDAGQSGTQYGHTDKTALPSPTTTVFAGLKFGNHHNNVSSNSLPGPPARQNTAQSSRVIQTNWFASKLGELDFSAQYSVARKTYGSGAGQVFMGFFVPAGCIAGLVYVASQGWII